jgi:hypothetical protein
MEISKLKKGTRVKLRDKFGATIESVDVKRGIVQGESLDGTFTFFWLFDGRSVSSGSERLRWFVPQFDIVSIETEEA